MKVKKEVHPLKSFFSLVLILSSLFLLVFLQMEERRMGYELLKLNKELKKTTETRRLANIKMIRLSRPEKIEEKAIGSGVLIKAEHSQIINLLETE